MQPTHQHQSSKSPSTLLSYFQSYLVQIHPDTFSKPQISHEQSEKNHLMFFNALFSPKDTAQSLQRRNENLQMINFDNSDSQPDEIYVRRKKKVSQLQKKEESQLQELQHVKYQNQNKYRCFVDFMKFFYEVKQKVDRIRTDYYSTKTFYALKNSSQADIAEVTNVCKRMFNNIMKKPRFFNEEQSLQENGVDGRVLQFLIIPRFLISKEKLSRLCKDTQLQEHFQFLVQHECLGHYNNQANKKLPEEKQMKYIQDIMKRSNGRLKFKKICSINHGNKFFKNYGESYFQLYSKSLKYLRHLDSELKKGRKYSNVKEELNKFPLETEETEEQSQSLSQSSSSNRFSFKSFRDALNGCDSEKKDDRLIIGENFSERMGQEKFLTNSFQQPKKSVFRVKKSLTYEPKTTPNILLVQPPDHQINQV